MVTAVELGYVVGRCVAASFDRASCVIAVEVRIGLFWSGAFRFVRAVGVRYELVSSG